MMRIQRFDNAELLSAAVADLLRERLAVPRRAGGAVMLSGGQTPLHAYEILAASPLPAQSAPRVFFSDERHVPLTSPDSNAGRIEPLLARAGVPAESWWRAPVELPLEAAAEAYHRILETGLAEGPIGLGLLGLGTDGHTASLFSLDQVERGQRSGKLAMAVSRRPGPDRISVTPCLIAAVQRIVFVVAGADKAAIVKQLLDRPDTLPAGAAVRGHPDVHLWADAAALSQAPVAAL